MECKYVRNYYCYANYYYCYANNIPSSEICIKFNTLNETFHYLIFF